MGDLIVSAWCDNGADRSLLYHLETDSSGTKMVEPLTGK